MDSGSESTVYTTAQKVPLGNNSDGGSPPLSAETVSYVSWYATALLLHMFTVEKSFLQRLLLAREGARKGADEGAGSSHQLPLEGHEPRSTRVLLQLWKEDGDVDADAASGMGTSVQGDLAAIFDGCVFPDFLFSNNDETCMSSTAAGNGGGSGSATPDQLRDGFHAAVKLLQQCAHAALGTRTWETEPSSPTPAFVSDYSASSADEGCTHVHSTHTHTAASGGGVDEADAAGTALQLVLRLAFNCPSDTVSVAAQLVLADALAAYRRGGALRDKCERLAAYFPRLLAGGNKGSCLDEALLRSVFSWRRSDRFVLVDRHRIPRVDLALTDMSGLLRGARGPLRCCLPWTTPLLQKTERLLYVGDQSMMHSDEVLRLFGALAQARHALAATQQHKHVQQKVSLTRRRAGAASSTVRLPQHTSAPHSIPALSIATSEVNAEDSDDDATRNRALLMSLSQGHLIPDAGTVMAGHELLYTIFTEMGGYCPSYCKALARYPEFLRAHHAAMRVVFYGDGPLPIAERLMIAIMAASRHRCEYLIAQYAATLLRCGADGGSKMDAHHHHRMSDSGREDQNDATSPQSEARTYESWLLHGPPPHAAAAQRLIALAAHTPWVVSQDDYKQLVRVGWTVPELFQLIAIVSHVLPLSSFVLGLCIPTEPWTWAVLPAAVTDALRHPCLKHYTTAMDTDKTDQPPDTPSAAPAANAFGRVGSMDQMADLGSCPSPSPPPPAAPDVFLLYAGESSIVSEQRIQKTLMSSHSLWRNHFSWQEVGASCMEQYYPGAAALLNEQMDCFNDIVGRLHGVDCVGIVNTDGAVFSPSYIFHSLQLYVLNLIGFMVEDYPYNEINKVLRRQAKWYAQALTTRPEGLSFMQVRDWGLMNTAAASSGDGVNCNRRAASPLRAPHNNASSSGSGSSGSASMSAAAVYEKTRNGDLLSFVGGGSTAQQQPLAVDEDVLGTAITLQDEHARLLTAIATMVARTEGLLHIMLCPLWTTLNNM